MRNVILQAFVTLEGFAAGPNGSVDFIPAATKDDRSFGRQQLALMGEVDTILLGRITYQMFSGYWPDAKGEEREFAHMMSATPKIVFSRTLDRAPWGTWPECRIVATDPAEELERLKRAPGKNIVMWGSISVAQQLMKAGLIDEYRLVICPVALGDGRPLFAHAVPLEISLSAAEKLDRGALYATYARPGHSWGAAVKGDRRTTAT
jgi:dihydrofolate reductase